MNEPWSWVWDVDFVSSTEKFVLLYLAFHADDAGRITIGKARLAERCGLSKRALDCAINSLAHHKLIAIYALTVDRANKAHTYELRRPEVL